MRVIFLDFDGVINNMDTTPVDKRYLSILKTIIDATGALVVVTASMKYPFQRHDVSYYDSGCFNNYVKPIEEFGISVFGFTPYVNSNREEEIMAYLDSHPEIENFLILDDDYFFDRWNGHEIFIDLDFGLAESDIEPAINILNGNLFYYDTKKIITDSNIRCDIMNKRYRKLS